MIKKTISFILFLLIVNQFIFSNNSKSFVTFPKVEYTKEEIKLKNFDTIYLVAASPTNEHIGSVGAHTFILLAHGDDISNAMAINFYAYHESLGEAEKNYQRSNYWARRISRRKAIVVSF